MNKLTKYPLSSLYDMSSGISSTKEQAGHGAPFVSFSTVFNNYFLPNELPDLMDTSESEQKTYSIKEGDILITRTSETIDELAMSCVALKDYPKATYSGFTKRLRPKTTGIAYPKYLAFYLRSYLFRNAVTNNAFMTLRASFNGDIFSFLNLYLPPYEQQVKIGDFLYLIEKKQQLNNQIIIELESMAKTIFDYWFVQFEFPNEEGKPYRSSNGEMVWCDELKKEIPKGWEIHTLNDLCTFRNGINYEKNCEGTKKYRIVNVRNITASNILLNKMELDEILLPQKMGDKYVLQENDIIIARSGTPGATRLLLNCDDSTVFCGFIICCTPKLPSYRLFLTYLLKSLEGTNATKTGGSILQNVSQDTLKNIKLVLPPFEMLNDFNEIVGLYFSVMQEKMEESNTLKQFRNWLLPLLMNGQATII